MMHFVQLLDQGQWSTIPVQLKKENELLSVQHYQKAIWVEMLNPTDIERAFILQQANIDLPEHHELHQIEFSNQFYRENAGIFLTLNLVTIVYPLPEIHAVNIIVAQNKIFTVRYSDPNPIELFLEKLVPRPTEIKNHYQLLGALLQSFIGKNADNLELAGERTNFLSLILSSGLSNHSLKNREGRLNETLKEINVLEGLISMVYQSVSSLEMLVNYLEQNIDSKLLDLKGIKRDIFSLLKQADYLNQKVVFQLDSTLGLINIEQMGIVKIFTVLAMVFMPPTLIASIYGMNFKHMPELQSAIAYPIVLGAIALSAYFPWMIFRRKGWI